MAVFNAITRMNSMQTNLPTTLARNRVYQVSPAKKKPGTKRLAKDSGVAGVGVGALVERFDIEPLSDFSAK